MEPRKSSTTDFFEGERVFVVPKYQRMYVWNLEDQWEPLWLDIVEIADELYRDARERNKDKVNPAIVESHFMGAVVLKKGGIVFDDAQEWKIIDGQQRTTTIQLLMAAIYKNLKKGNLDQQAKRLNRLIDNSAVENESSRIKLKHSDLSYDQFRNVMQSVLNDVELDVETGGPMVDCFTFFYNKGAEWLNERSSNLQLAASALTGTLMSKLHFISIFLESKDKEHQIFEALNARGEPLTEWDKIKNYLLYKADTIIALDQDKLYDDYLTNFDDEWWREFEGRGVQQRPRTDTFTDYWLESRIFEFVGTKRVFKEFKKYIDGIDQDKVESEIEQFFSDAEYYRLCSRVDFAKSDFETQFHNRRILLSIGAVWPLLLYLHRKGFSAETKTRYFRCLDSYFMRRKICWYQARGYDQVSLDIINLLEESKVGDDQVANLICEKLIGYNQPANIWPKAEIIVSRIKESDYAQQTNRILLRAIETHLNSKLSGGTLVRESVHVEHLMPTAWNNNNWPISDYSDDAVDERNRLIKTLGNLTLLNGPLNIRLQNSSWSVKRKAIFESDNLFLNKQLRDQYFARWDESTIRERGESIANLILKLWPYGIQIS